VCYLREGKFVVLELDVGGGFVVVVQGLVGVQPYCLFIEINGLVEVLSLELFVPFVLHILSRVLNLHLLCLLLLSLRGRRGRRAVLLFLRRGALFFFRLWWGLLLLRFLSIKLSLIKLLS
jgi:hypothetical protein